MQIRNVFSTNKLVRKHNVNPKHFSYTKWAVSCDAMPLRLRKAFLNTFDLYFIRIQSNIEYYLHWFSELMGFSQEKTTTQKISIENQCKSNIKNQKIFPLKINANGIYRISIHWSKKNTGLVPLKKIIATLWL